MGLLACLKGMLDHIAGHGSLYHPAWTHSFDVRKTALKLNLWVALKSHTVGSKNRGWANYFLSHCTGRFTFRSPSSVPHAWSRSSTSGSIHSPGIRSPSRGVQRQLLLLSSWEINRLLCNAISLFTTQEEKTSKHPKNICENLFFWEEQASGDLPLKVLSGWLQGIGVSLSLQFSIWHWRQQHRHWQHFLTWKTFPICKRVTRQLSCKDT